MKTRIGIFLILGCLTSLGLLSSSAWSDPEVKLPIPFGLKSLFTMGASSSNNLSHDQDYQRIALLKHQQEAITAKNVRNDDDY